jgi:energy-coupling factor transporter ATP-binding protein EcfA2
MKKRLLPQMSGFQRRGPVAAPPLVADTPLLDVDRLTVRFGGLVAVSEVSLDVPEGSIVSLIGPNGAGKTTAFNTISGIDAPTSGAVRFRGRRLEQSFTAGTFWAAMGIGLITGLLCAAAAVDVDRLWLAVVKRGMLTGEPFSVAGALERLRGYFRAELALDQMAGKWRVVSADGSDVLAIRRDLAEARALRDRLQAAVTARRAGPGTVPDASDLSGPADPVAGAVELPAIKEEVLDRLAAGKRRVRLRPPPNRQSERSHSPPTVRPSSPQATTSSSTRGARPPARPSMY